MLPQEGNLQGVPVNIWKSANSADALINTRLQVEKVHSTNSIHRLESEATPVFQRFLVMNLRFLKSGWNTCPLGTCTIGYVKRT